MLEDDRTTLVEVFDTRWSHCHQWAGCPTWQLTRYALGLHPRYSEGEGVFALRFVPLGLHRGEGVIPLKDGGKVTLRWHEQDSVVHYTLDSTRPITLLLPHMDGSEERREVTDKLSCTLQHASKGDSAWYRVLDI